MADCIVIGGGLIGMATARELALAGLDVSVTERGQVGRECSWAAGGILSSLTPWRDAAALNELSRYSREIYEPYARELWEETGIDPEWQRSGLLLLECVEVEAVSSWARGENLQCELLGPAQIASLEPLLRDTERESLWIPEIAQIRTPRLIRALKRSLQGLGVRILENTPVTGIQIRQGRFESISTAEGSLEAETAVIAGGAWSAHLLGLLGYGASLRPMRGQIICYMAPDPGIRSLLSREDYYLIPRRDGHCLVGSTVEDCGFNGQTTTAAREELAAAACRFSPQLASAAPLHHWAGLRPATADGLPLICQVPGITGLYLNTGHFRNGILQAPGAGRLLADILLSRTPFMTVDTFTHRDIVSMPEKHS